MGISTHILDTSCGRPAAGVGVTLEFLHEGRWTTLQTSATDQDGRCKHLHPEGHRLAMGTYRIRFATSEYFEAQRVDGLYPVVDVTFTVTNPQQHYHIPLLLTAHGYTTYRGS